MKPPSIPLTAKAFDGQKVGLCAGCGCGCAYVLYTAGGRPVDLYGHPADPKGMGSLCSKGITYIQEIPQNPLRLLGAYLNEEEPKRISQDQALELAKGKLKGKIAIVLDRHLSSLEDYLLARSVADVFVDAPVVDFRPSTAFFNRWQDYKLILSWEAEPVFSEVMATRYIVDGVEKGAHLVCISSKFATICSKAKTRLLLNPFQQLSFMRKLIQPEHDDPVATELKKKLRILNGILLINTDLLSSPFRGSLLNLLKQLIKHFSLDYSFVGDLMPLPAKELKDFVENVHEYESFVFFGNPLVYVPEDVRKEIKKRFSIHFTLFPNLTSQYSTLVLGSANFTERDFIAYRNSFGEVYFCPKTLEKPEDAIVPYEFLSKVFGLEVKVEEFELNLPPLEAKSFEGENIKAGTVIYTSKELVEELGHWNPWTHQMEKYQRAYMSEKTARKLMVRERITISQRDFEVFITPNIVDDVIFVPSTFDEFQPFDPGYSVGSFTKHPYYRYEVIQ